MAPSVDPSQWTYTDYVCFLRSHGFPQLGVLDEYLEWGLYAKSTPQIRQAEPSRTMLLEFTKNQTRVSDTSDLKKMRLLLNEWTRPRSAGSTSSSSTAGRIVMVENASPAVIDTLGGILNIDPSFFASHIDDPSMSHSPDSSTSPSLESKSARDRNDFFTVEYISAFMPVGCPKEVEGLALQCKGNYARRIELIQKQGRQKVALARRKISFWMKKTSASEPWLCVILVDPPLGNFSTAFTNFSAVIPSQSFPVVPYEGGYLDFVSIRKPLDRDHHDFRDCRHRHTSPSAFDDLIRHYQIQARDGLFNTTTTSSSSSSKPTLPLFMRPCLQLAASETGAFLSYISHTLTSQPPHLTPPHDHPKLRRTLDRAIFIDTLLSRLEPSLTLAKHFCSSSTSTPDLQTDYRSLLSTLHHHRSTCDSQLTHLNTLLSTADSASLSLLATESLRRADYLRYLTIIALIYAPFALACAVFTMPSALLPSKHYLYGFLPITAVVTLIFVLLVLPESRDPWPSLKDTICGGLTRKKLLAGEKKRPSTRDSSSTRNKDKWGWDDV